MFHRPIEVVTNDEDSRFWEAATHSHHKSKVAATVIVFTAAIGALSYFAVDTAQHIFEREKYGVTVERGPIIIDTTSTTLGRCALENLDLPPDATLQEQIYAARRCQENPEMQTIEDLNSLAQNTTPQS